MITLLLALLTPDIDGATHRYFEPGPPTALFFVTHDCPVANRYAPEIRRICADYQRRGLQCALVYVDPTATAEKVRAHAAEYQHGDYPRIIDRDHRLVKAAGATTTPEVALLGRDGKLAYRGRIDDLYVTWGKSHRTVGDPTLRRALDAYLAGQPVTPKTTKAIGCFIADLIP
ncbi:MAG: redoxin family protein [Bryobacteraceae bacterium]|nr:redoxin family protein [Bryobacteraceae bacterium]